MRAKVTHAFQGRRAMDVEPVDIKVGAELTDGGLAFHAVQMGYAEWIEPPSEAEASILGKAPRPNPPLPPLKVASKRK